MIERKIKRAGLLGSHVQESILNSNDPRKKCSHDRRSFCKICSKITNVYYFGRKKYLHLKAPLIQDKYAFDEFHRKHASISNFGEIKFYL